MKFFTMYKLLLRQNIEFWKCRHANIGGSFKNNGIIEVTINFIGMKKKHVMLVPILGR